MSPHPTPDHVLGSTPETVVWGRLTPHLPPVLRVRSGQSVAIDTLNPVGIQPQAPHEFLIQHGIATHGPVAEILAVMAAVPKGPGPHILTGPIHIEDAQPGDTLEIQIESLQIREPAYGVNYSRPGAGGLPQLLQDEWLRVLSIDVQAATADFGHGISLPLAPFMGTMGVAPTTEVSSIPPGPFGGNIDLKHLRPGSRLYLPVLVPGALFFAGDGHAVQGHGEVNLTALETSLSAVFRFVLHQNCPITGPVAETAEHYIPLGLNTSLDIAATQAVARTVDILATQLGISPAEAYALASLLTDYEVTQIVDGVKGIHGCIPKRLVQPQGPAWWGPGPAAQMGTAMRSHFSQGDLA